MNFGYLGVSYCSFTGNTAFRGGAICNDAVSFSDGSSVSVGNSTFFANRAIGQSVDDDGSARFYPGLGSALYNKSGNSGMDNCTLTGNIVSGSPKPDYKPDPSRSGGAIYIGANGSGELYLTNCTLSGNTNVTTGIDNAAKISTLYNSTNRLFCLNNVFVDSAATPFYGLTTPSARGDADKNFFFPSNAQAGLNDLADNGGSVETMALTPDSPLIDAGRKNEAPPL